MPHARASRQLQPNRADLTRPTAQAVPGQGYGQESQDRAAQQAIPMGMPPVGTSPSGAQPTPQAAPTQNPQMPLAIPGANGPISRPTERPNEPVTHGLPMGPGAGPEALQGIGAAAREGSIEQGTLGNLLTNLASAPGATSAIRDLAARSQGGAM